MRERRTDSGARLGSRERRLAEEVARYRDCVSVHDVPPVHDLWAERHVRPKLEACGYPGLGELFVTEIARRARAAPGRVDVVSLGAGNCDFELGLARALVDQGILNFSFRCLELNPAMLERGLTALREAGLESHFELEAIDLDDWADDRPADVCIANHSLHHLVNLEAILDRVVGILGSPGAFLVNDMIGRNGHRRWPEALRLVEAIWSELPRRFKYNHQLGRVEDRFVNWDCSREGNEGIRSQDILPLLRERFHFAVFVAFGSLVDVFVDRSFGPNFDVSNPVDVELIEAIAALDERAIDSGVVTPTHLVGVLRTVPVGRCRHYRHWTPEFCQRRADREDP